MEPKIDLNKYAGMTREEANRQMAEDERRAILEDPRTIAAIQQGQRERAAREAEVERRRRQEETQREAKARAQLEAEKERQKRIWIASGNPVEKFEAAWPEIEKQVLMERRQATLSRIEIDSVF